MNFKLSDLDEIIKIIVSKTKIDNLDINKDYYWNIDPESKFNPNKDPELNIGSLSDDLEYLNLILQKKHDPNILDFERLGNLLIYIGEHISKSEDIY